MSFSPLVPPFYAHPAATVLLLLLPLLLSLLPQLLPLLLLLLLEMVC